MKLNTKFGILLIVSSILGLIVFIALSLIVGNLFSKGYTTNDLNAIGNQVIEEIGEDPSNPERIIDLLEHTVSVYPQLELEWVAADGLMIYATNGRSESYSFHELANRFLYIPHRYWEPGLDSSLLFSWGEDNPQYLIMQFPDEAVQGSQILIYVRENREFITLILPLLMFLATPYFVSFIFFLRMNRRLKKLTTAMNAVKAENSVIMIKDHSKDEIGQLTRHFNTMSQRISEQIKQIQEFEKNRKTLIANLSHDLRTPMTKIQGYAETLYEELLEELDESAENSKTFADIILRHSRYMDKLLQKLLEISDLDSRRGSVNLIETNVSMHLRKISADFVPILENKGITFHIQIPDHPIYALADAYLLERAIRNLIENAIQYGGSGHYLGISLEESSDELHIRITDRGTGISEENISHIFERFYRGSAAREGEGMGIGLSIVREIAEAHHGRIDVRSAANEETVFTLTLPRIKGISDSEHRAGSR